jgi:hypothetical protein
MTLEAERKEQDTVPGQDEPVIETNLDISRSGIWSAFSVWQTRVKFPAKRRNPDADQGWDPYEVWESRIKR